MKRYYAAYGSNLNLSQMKMRCSNSKAIGTAMIDGYELLFKGSLTGSYLTIEPNAKSQVPVGIFEVNSIDEKALDRYEGYPTFYYKKEMTLPVMLASGNTEKLKIFVSIMDESRKLGLPTVHYAETCIEGYKDFGFDKKYLDEAIRRSSGYENKDDKETLPHLPKGVHRLSGHFKKR